MVPDPMRHRDPRYALRLLLGDQDRQLERLDQRDPTKLARRRFGTDQIPVLKCSSEPGPRSALRSRRPSFPGPGGTPSLERLPRSA